MSQGRALGKTERASAFLIAFRLHQRKRSPDFDLNQKLATLLNYALCVINIIA